MPPPRIFCARQAEREAEFRQASSRAEVEMLLKAWSDEDRQAAHQVERPHRLDDIERRTNHDRIEDLAARVEAVEGSLLPGGDFFDQLVQALGDHIGQIRRRLADLEAGLLVRKGDDDLVRRVDELERAQMRFRGTYKSGELYRGGDLTIRSGSLWVCLESTTEPPGGSGSGHWRLAVKRGSVASREPGYA
jgi:hypothetical protein